MLQFVKRWIKNEWWKFMGARPACAWRVLRGHPVIYGPWHIHLSQPLVFPTVKSVIVGTTQNYNKCKGI